jgi:hypothetical protein
MERELPPGAALVLAEPRPGIAGSIEWHTPLEGFARELGSLLGNEREEAESALRQRASELAGLGVSLASSQDQQEKAAARLLSRLAAALAAQAAGLTAPERVFVAGGTPVLACWWRLPAEESDPAASAPPVPAEAPQPAAPWPGAAGPSAPPGAAPTLGQPAQLPPAGAPAGPPFLRAALTALGAFLLASLACYLRAPGFRSAAGAAGSDPAAAAGPADGLEAGLREELDALRDRYRGQLSACVPEAPEPPPDYGDLPGLPVPEGLPATPPPAAGDPPSGLEAAPPPPPAPKPRPRPRPEPRPEPRTDPRQDGQATPRTRPAPGGRLQIPDNPTDLAFLEGCWKSDAGIFNRSGTPLYCIYCFDGNGRATAKVEELDERGRVTQTCTGSATARFSGGKLTIRDSGTRCPSGPGYVPDTVICQPSSGGVAVCTLQSDGGSVIPTRITYQGGRR